MTEKKRAIEIRLDNFDADDNPDSPWSASVAEMTNDGIEFSDAAFGATPREALLNLLADPYSTKEFGL